jgi:phospholipid-binding lipoprotein MlaA
MARLQAATRDPLLAARMGHESRRQSATAFSYVVNSAIAQYPASAREIISAAISFAPDLRTEIVQSAVLAFPGFREEIGQGRPGKYKLTDVQPPATTLFPAPQMSPPRQYEPPPVPARANRIWDPWEPVNRPLFAMHQFLDDFLIRPVAQGYGWITPGPIRRGVRKAFANLASPIVFANDLLQFQADDAAVTLGRFVVNSAVGGLGFFDVAARAGLPGHPADFDQTLNFYHVPAGPYVLAPVIGPGTVRHHFGRFVDLLADPLNWAGDVDNSIKIGLRVGETAAMRENLIEPLDSLRKDSLDWYATYRAVYYQDRNVVLRKGKTLPEAAQNDLFDEAR